MLDLKLLIKTNINDKVDSNVSFILHATCTSWKKLNTCYNTCYFQEILLSLAIDYMNKQNLRVSEILSFILPRYKFFSVVILTFTLSSESEIGLYYCNNATIISITSTIALQNLILGNLF